MHLIRRFSVVSALLMGSSLLGAAQAAPAPSKRPQQSAATTAPAPQRMPETKIDPAKEADIRKLLDMSGAGAIAVQTIDAMLTNIKPMLAANLPPGDYRDKLIDLFFEKFRSKADARQVMDLVVPIYDKHFSHEEVKALIQFYQTPLGKKTISVLPVIAQESRQAGENWGQALGRDSMNEVLAEHPDLANAMAAASKNVP